VIPRDDSGKLIPIQVTGRRLNKETDLNQFVTIDEVKHTKKLQIWGIQNNSFSAIFKPRYYHNDQANPDEKEKDSKKDKRQRDKGKQKQSDIVKEEKLQEFVKKLTQVNLEKKKEKPLVELSLPRNFDLSNSMLMLKDGTLSKDGTKFNLHLCVSIRTKTLTEKTPSPVATHPVNEPLLKSGLMEKMEIVPNGFVPFSYEPGRGLPDSLRTITQFGVNILWRKNASFKSTVTKTFLGIIALDPGIKSFLSGVSECGDEFLFLPNLPGYLDQLEKQKQDLQSKMDTEKNNDPNVVFIGNLIESLKQGYYKELRCTNKKPPDLESNVNWLSRIDHYDKKYHAARMNIKNPYLESGINSILKLKHRAVKKLHNLSALFLSQWKFVVLPEFSIKTFSTSKSLQKSKKKLLASLSHGAFRVKLKRQLSMRGNCLLNASEDWSTKVCNSCCKVNYPGLSRTYSCSNRDCKLKVRRDTNGAANILSFTMARILNGMHQKPYGLECL